MCPDKVRRPFADAASDAGAPRAARRGIGTPLAVGCVAAWLLYAAVYAVTFAVSGVPIFTAIRGGLANAIPDGMLALAVIAMSRRIDRGPASRPHPGRHVVWAALLVPCATLVKTLLLYIDVTVVRGRGAFKLSAGILAWQIFLSALIYVTVASTTHAWLIARRLREEEAHAARAETLRARADLSALRAQLNPHFLFNVLHSVLGMVRRDPALAESALENLGDLLHYAIRVHRDGVDWTALRHEWEFMETYLDLEKVRLGGRLLVSKRVDDAALDRSVPTFSLQPLVENAVRHGIAPRAEGGRITVESRLEGEALILEVSNDGNGLGAVAEGDEGGLGLRVLRERLQVLYRGRARMTAGPAAGGGYNVVLALPSRTGDEEGGE